MLQEREGLLKEAKSSTKQMDKKYKLAQKEVVRLSREQWELRGRLCALLREHAGAQLWGEVSASDEESLGLIAALSAAETKFNAYGAEIRELRQEVGGSREAASKAKEEVARLKNSLTFAQKGHLITQKELLAAAHQKAAEQDRAQQLSARCLALEAQLEGREGLQAQSYQDLLRSKDLQLQELQCRMTEAEQALSASQQQCQWLQDKVRLQPEGATELKGDQDGQGLEMEQEMEQQLYLADMKSKQRSLEDKISFKQQSITSLLVEKEEEIQAVSGRLEASVGEGEGLRSEVERYRGLVEDLHKEIAQRETNALQDLNTVTGDGEALQECATVQDMVSRGPRAEGLRVQRSRAQLSQLEQREELQTGRDGADQREQLSARCSALEAQLAAAHLEVAVEQDRTQQHRVRCSALLSQLERRYGDTYFQQDRVRCSALLSQLERRYGDTYFQQDRVRCSALLSQLERRYGDTYFQQDRVRCSALLSQLERRYGNAYFQLQQSKSELSQQWAELQTARDGADQLSARWTAAEIRLADTHLQREESRVKLQQEREGEIAGRDEFNAYGAEIRELRQEVGGSREMAAEAKEEVARLKTSLTSAQKGHLRRRRSSRTRSSRR